MDALVDQLYKNNRPTSPTNYHTSAWVNLMLETATQNPEKHLRLDLRQTLKTDNINEINPHLIADYLNLKHINLLENIDILEEGHWNTPNFNTIITKLLNTELTQEHYYLLNLRRLDEKTTTKLLNTFKAHKYHTLKHLLRHNYHPRTHLANAAIAFTPKENLTPYIKAATNSDAIARRLLSLPQVNLNYYLTAAKHHTFTPYLTKRLIKRVEKHHPNTTTEHTQKTHILKLLNTNTPTTSKTTNKTGQTLIQNAILDAHNKHQNTTQTPTQYYNTKLDEILNGENTESAAKTSKILTAAKGHVNEEKITQARTTWITNLNTHTLPLLASNTTHQENAAAATDELVKRGENNDPHALIWLLKENNALTKRVKITTNIKNTIPIPELKKHKAGQTLIQNAILDTYTHHQLQGANTLAQLLTNHTGTLTQLVNTTHAALTKHTE